jgi:hypothetical protein
MAGMLLRWRKWLDVGGVFVAMSIGAGVLLAAPAAASVARQTTAVTVTVRCPANGPQLSGFPKTFPLDVGGSMQITGIPAGVLCSVTQTDQGGASSVTYATNGGAPSASPPDVAVSPGALQNVNISDAFPPPPPPPPPKVAPAVAVRDVLTEIPRAFVAGDPLRIGGAIPPGCDPYLVIDGQRQPSVPPTANDTFNLGVATSTLPAGRHVASVSCTQPAAEVARTVFWVAAAQTSSNIFFVVIASLLVVFAVGWVILRTLAGSAGVSSGSQSTT